MARLRRTAVLGAILALGAAVSVASPRNVILMIADGAGQNTWRATALWLGNEGRDFHDEEPWVRTLATTHELRAGRGIIFSDAHATTQFPGAPWDPKRAWDATPAAGEHGGFPYFYEGYRWLREGPDSANTGTTLSTGVKTYTGAINVDGRETPIPDTLAALAHRSGRGVGVVTSVPFNHATPAALGGAHAPSRKHYCELALDMLSGEVLSVVAGAGHPDFDNNGERIADPERKDYRYVGSRELWRALGGESPETICGKPVDASTLAALHDWTRVETRRDVRALAKGRTAGRILVLPRVGQRLLFDGVSREEEPYHELAGGTLQQARGSRTRPDLTEPGDDPKLDTVPTLAELTRAALNALDDDPEGLFLTVEGGAVDWAMHANQMGRMIEEMLAFREAIDAVTAWVERGAGWDDTLLVVTADHDHLLWGPESHRVPFQPLGDNGAGKLPSYRWLSKGHSRLPVPVFARGRGAATLLDRIRGEDPYLGEYVDQADVHAVLREALLGSDPHVP